jgi:hypothetical protein
VEALAGCILLALTLCSAFLLFSKRRSTFTDTLVGVLQQRNPSGLRPLWIGLAIAGGAFVIYIAVSG